ncbi:CRISPR system precrRNA processing endoribonuclease RAMP protein Cas6 [Paenibacillus sp. SGZ-1009]|uniref:CRISPR system precrRNA processing endoribonuclease RAMP protein Cas6 n=1 Tax=Paenibacillus campi TaxID=3106031 RepID=UPI002B002EDA|nr:CRISPR system precrRNA processing endoribonuclease RAMP protein Cas6 [Paenibacillus sp. SGZ-1009]
MKKKNTIFSMSYVPLLIRLQCKEDTRLPPFLGSTLHGVTGWILRQHKESYQYLFENKQTSNTQKDIVNPYLIQPPRPKTIYCVGDILCFQLVLFGDSIRYTEQIICSLAKDDEFKLGAQRKAFKLIDILHGEQFAPIWQNEEIMMKAAIPQNIDSYRFQELASWCSVQFITPIRIRRNGELLQQFEFATIIRNITRRVQALTARYGGHVDEQVAVEACELAQHVHCQSASFYMSEMHRYSSRQKQSMEWNGILGTMTFEGDLSVFTPWLNVARILNIGRNSTLGYGQIDVVYR